MHVLLTQRLEVALSRFPNCWRASCSFWDYRSTTSLTESMAFCSPRTFSHRFLRSDGAFVRLISNLRLLHRLIPQQHLPLLLLLRLPLLLAHCHGQVVLLRLPRLRQDHSLPRTKPRRRARKKRRRKKRRIRSQRRRKTTSGVLSSITEAR